MKRWVYIHIYQQNIIFFSWLPRLKERVGNYSSGKFEVRESNVSPLYKL